ncbi:hypothetical protein [Lichenibacterium ramalinae]|nr:hypothetical protein [Lichenibacterium ramalinae]
MTMSKRHAAAAAAVATCLVVGPVASARAENIHERGTITAVDGATVTVKDRDGKDVTLNLDDGWKIGGVAKATMADIKPGTFIGTATSGDESGLKAIEVVVFPPAMKGTGEGHYAWDLQPKSMMTNATVDNEVKGTDGKSVRLSYKGGEKTVDIKDTTPIVQFVDGTKADLVPGAKVFIVTPGMTGGKLEKGFVAVGKDGVTPPM